MRTLLLAACVLIAGCVAGADGEEPVAPATAGTRIASSSTTSQASPAAMSSTTIDVQPAPSDVGGADATGGRAFVDVTAAFGLVDPLTGMHGHAAAWGDVNGDGAVDLVVGTFADRPTATYQQRGASGASPDRLLFMGEAGFAPEADLGKGRTSGAVFADLDGDMDNDLVLSRNVKSVETDGDPTVVFENVDGALVARTESGLSAALGGRTIGVFDENGDGLLDLFIVEDQYAGGSSRLLRNTGDLTFVDVTESRGLPSDLEGLGVATVDLDGDHLADLFVSGSNRMFVGTEEGFVEVDSTVFAWETFGAEDLVAGVAAGDLDRDGRLDLVVGHHFNSTIDFGTEVPVRVYLNRSQLGDLAFVDVTDAVGMVGLPTKAPHVEIVDLDNDGWPDILTSASASNGAIPAVFMHQGMADGLPRFSPPAGLGSSQYWVTTPTADVDGDLRLDMIAVEWEPSLPSLLLRNEQQAGKAVRIEFRGIQPIGSEVSVFDASTGELIGYREVVASVGYTAGIESVAHFGIGDRASIDLQIRSPDGSVQTLDGVPANSVVTVGR